MGRDPHHVLVLEAALVPDCPCRRDSASSFSPGTNPSAQSHLKIPFQALKITPLFFFSAAVQVTCLRFFLADKVMVLKRLFFF